MLVNAPWFHANGIRTFPIKSRSKEPACASWDDLVVTAFEAANFINYGVVLGSLSVIDTDSPEAEAWAIANAPPTPFVVKTARGLHRYYRLISAAPHFIHRDGLTLENRNLGQYVVGPGSIHATGFIYEALPWSWNITDVPFFDVHNFRWEDRQEGTYSAPGAPLQMPERIVAGERHDLLFKLMRSLQARGIQDPEHLLMVLTAENLAKCSPPISDSELARYIPRAAKHRDREHFVRIECADAQTMVGSLIDIGVSYNATLVAARILDPQYDPNGSAPPVVDVPKTKKTIKEHIADIEQDIADLDESDVIDDPWEHLDMQIVDEKDLKK